MRCEEDVESVFRVVVRRERVQLVRPPQEASESEVVDAEAVEARLRRDERERRER